jgi:hypothetical protein
MDASGRERVERFLDATRRGDDAEMRARLHPDMVMAWPQSGERFVGRENAIAAMLVRDVEPEVVGEPRLIGSGDVWVAMMPLRYGDDIYHYVGVIELEAGLVRRGTGYFAAPFPAQANRARYAEGRSDP